MKYYNVHWTTDFGCFPTYYLGNIYGSMYYKKMREDMDVDGLLREGRLSEITDWMREKVFSRAAVLSPKEWIQDITVKEICAGSFLDYLEEKYADIFGLHNITF